AMPVFVKPARIALMFLLTVIGWVIFRPESIGQMVYLLSHLSPAISSTTRSTFVSFAGTLLPLAIVQLLQYRSGNLMVLATRRPVLQGATYAIGILLILIFGVREQ